MNNQIKSPQEKLTFNMLRKHLLHIETKDINVKFIFDLFKNFLVCSALLWGGMNVLSSTNQLPSNIFVCVGGVALIIISLVLCVLNVNYGLEAYSKLRKIESVSNFIIACVAAVSYCVILAILSSVKNS